MTSFIKTIATTTALRVISAQKSRNNCNSSNRSNSRVTLATTVVAAVTIAVALVTLTVIVVYTNFYGNSNMVTLAVTQRNQEQ